MENLRGWIVSLNTGPGGVPRYPRLMGDFLDENGFRTDIRAFAKHNREHRALSILDINILAELQGEGYRVAPGIMAENLTVAGLDTRQIRDGSLIRFESGVTVKVSEQRRPCFQLNPMGDNLENEAKGRAGVFCSVVETGHLKPGMTFEVFAPEAE